VYHNLTKHLWVIESSLRSAPEWILPPLSASGTLGEAGQWSIYLRDTAGKSVAYRTFLQSDADRPYTIAAIVAFDMRAVRLHFVLGHDEPRSTMAIPRTGKIPLADFTTRPLLAAFNGGFKARHGQFGAMVDGTIALPPKAGFATVAIYRDGRVRIGAWGTDILADPDLVAWRQNGPLVILHGHINPHTIDSTSHDGGIILNGVTAIWRSGLRIGADAHTLYYVVGNSLTLSALVRTLATTGATTALQLDINIGMVHFDALQSTPAGLMSAPLFDAMKMQRDTCYLIGDKRDYFYVTAHGS